MEFTLCVCMCVLGRGQEEVRPGLCGTTQTGRTLRSTEGTHFVLQGPFFVLEQSVPFSVHCSGFGVSVLPMTPLIFYLLAPFLLLKPLS